MVLAALLCSILTRRGKEIRPDPQSNSATDRDHLRLRGCGRQPWHPHHLRFARGKGISQKVIDEFTVPSVARTTASCTEQQASRMVIDAWHRTTQLSTQALAQYAPD
jgi:hypothetical protein